MARDVLEENIYERKTKVMTADNEMNKSLIKGRKNGQTKPATCLATLLKNKLNSNVCAFYHPNQTFLATNQVVNRFAEGGKTRNIAIQLVLMQQCCKTGCTFFVARFYAP